MRARLLAAVAALTLVSGVSQAQTSPSFEPLSREELIKEGVIGALFLVDYAQTRDISASYPRRTEKNPILGEHPTDAAIARYFLGGALLHVAVLYALPKEYRAPFQNGTIILQGGVVARNAYFGIGMRW